MSNIDVDATKEQAEKAKLLPEPKGYRILCAVPQVEEEYEGGLIKADETKKVEEQTTVVLFVIKMGDQCYADKDRFPTGPWCERGNYVMFRANSGTRFRVGKQEYRLINDDSVEAVVDDPSKVTRA